MEVTLSKTKLNNDGSGLAGVIFQVPKSIDIELVIQFRLVAGKGGLHLEMLDVKRGE
ncbi:MAG: hypothetical protein JWL90_4696 [Chthoniobacteraceae bacterium]|nr:hypothetical protein [Chthoniobacteraceae bacterium]